MGYSVNPELLEAKRHLLRDLERGIASKWLVDGDLAETTRFAQELRELLYIARMYPKRFPALAEAADAWSIQVIGKGLIETRPKRRKGEIQLASSGEPFGKPVQSIGAHTADEVIKAWRDHLPSNDPVHFTQTTLSPEELALLYRFCRGNTPRLMMLVDEDQALLTVSLRDTSMDDFAWKPQRPLEGEESFDHL